MNGAVVRDTWFCPPAVRGLRGYDVKQVDDLLGRAAADLDAGGSAGALIQNATFRTRKYGQRYDIDAVDRFLDRLLLPADNEEPGGITDDPWDDLPVARSGEGDAAEYFYSRCENAWRDFGQVPGTHLWFGKAGRRLSELRTADQQSLASVRGSGWPDFSAGGRSVTLQPASAAEVSSPAVAELLTRAEAGHYAKNKRTRNTRERDVRKLVDETGRPILYTFGRNYSWRACAFILFPDLQWLRFLVRGTAQANAVMTAVDQTGNKVARYRCINKSGGQMKLWPRSSVEILVHPGRRLTDELAFVLALSADWLRSYFDLPKGGG